MTPAAAEGKLGTSAADLLSSYRHVFPILREHCRDVCATRREKAAQAHRRPQYSVRGRVRKHDSRINISRSPSFFCPIRHGPLLIQILPMCAKMSRGRINTELKVPISSGRRGGEFTAAVAASISGISSAARCLNLPVFCDDAERGSHPHPEEVSHGNEG